VGSGVERALRDLQEGRPRMARERLKSLVIAHPDDRRVRRLLAEAYRRDGQPTEAGRWGFLEDDAATGSEREAFVRHVRYPRDHYIGLGRLHRLLRCDDFDAVGDDAGRVRVAEVTRWTPRLLRRLARVLGRAGRRARRPPSSSTSPEDQPKAGGSSAP